MHASYNATPPALVEDSESTLDAVRGVVRFLQLLQRRIHVVGAIALAAFAIGLVYFLLAPREYESTAKLMIRQQAPDQVSSISEQSSSDTIMASQRELVRSAKVVQAAIDALPAEYRVDLINAPPRDWVDEIADRLHATAIRKTEHMEVRYRSADPEAASAVVAAVIDSYIRFVEKSHRNGAADVLEALKGERDQLNRKLSDKQQSLQTFRQRIGHLAMQPDSGVVEPIISRALMLNESVMRAQEKRLELEASLATVQQAIANGEDLRRHLALIEEAVGQQMLLAALGLGKEDAELLVKQQQSLLEAEGELRRISPYLGPGHPKTIALTKQIAATRQYLASYHANAGQKFDAMGSGELAPLLQNMLAQSVTQARTREHQLLVSFEQARAQAVRQSGDLAQLQMLEREVARIEKQHDVLFEKIAAVDIHQVQAPIRVLTVQDPLPNEAPVSPKLHVALGGATVLGLILGAMVVYVQDLLDDRFGSPEEMASQLGVPVLSLVRTLETTGGVGLDAVQMHHGGDDAELEAFRTLRTALALSGDASDRLVISSAEPSDGKTTVSANLAVSFAQVGKRTLVIDADMRRPGMTTLMNLKGQPGLTDLLLAEGSVSQLAEQVLHKTAIERLDIISAGPRRPDPAELLAGPNFADLLAWADGRYDQVLIDCPPVLAVSDAQIVGRLVDGVILVVSPEKNHRRLVSRACESFVAASVNLFGVVANRISEKTGSGYGYGYGYGYSYGVDEQDDEVIAHESDQPSAVIAADWNELAGGAKLADDFGEQQRAA
ncbi:MAG: polysaccharide biosynthesis tyrosine autokinase [Planctomycetota bacterium]